MHDFPPSWWPLTNYGLGAFPVMMFVVVAIVLLFSIRVTGSWKSCVARTAVLIAIPGTMMLAPERWRSSMYLPVQFSFFGVAWLLLVVIALQAVVRAFWKYRTAPNNLASAEILFVIGLACGFLIVFLLQPPPSAAAREAARRTQCKNNLKQIGLALHNYHDMHRMFPTPVQAKFDRSWRVTILPFLDRHAIYEKYDQQQTWDSDKNAPLAREIIPPFDCPSRLNRVDDQERFLSAYSALTGPGTAFGDNEYTTRRSFTDGLANTLMVAETCGKPIIGTQPKDVNTATDEPKINAPGDALHQSNGVMSSYHFGGAQVLLGDGSVRYIGEQLEPELLRQLMTRDGNSHGEPRTPDFF